MNISMQTRKETNEQKAKEKRICFEFTTSRTSATTQNLCLIAEKKATERTNERDWCNHLDSHEISEPLLSLKSRPKNGTQRKWTTNYYANRVYCVKSGGELEANERSNRFRVQNKISVWCEKEMPSTSPRHNWRCSFLWLKTEIKMSFAYGCRPTVRINSPAP